MADSNVATPQKLAPQITFQSQPPGLSSVEATPLFVKGDFQTPNNNQPTTYGNLVAVWEGGPAIPFQNAIVGSGPATANREDGTAYAIPVTGYKYFTTNYVIGYSAGPAATGGGYPNIIASAYIPGGVGSTQPMQFFGSSLAFVQGQLTPTSVVWLYTLPQGVDPAANNAFIGMWPGNVTNPYGSTPPITAAITNSGQSSGQVLMIGPQVTFAAGSQYTAALYTSGYPLQAGGAVPKNIAYWLNFTVQAV
jgi:hypothetical protein